MTPAQVRSFSPKSGSFMEIRGDRDLEILGKIYRSPKVTVLGDESAEGWGITYASEYHMTNDAKYFPPVAKWEEKDYVSDEYGHWLKGRWQPWTGADSAGEGDAVFARPSDPAKREAGTVLSQDRTKILSLDTLEDVALPLYQGVMMHQFDFAAKFYISGAGNRAQWGEQIPGRRIIRPQFLMGQKTYAKSNHTKIVFRSIARSTDIRTMIGTAITGNPTGNSLGVLENTNGNSIALAGNLSSYVFDYLMRIRITGTNVNWFLLQELPVLLPSTLAEISRLAELLAVNHVAFAPFSKLLPSEWVTDPIRRRSLRAELDARIAILYGLDEDDLSYILSGCDASSEDLSNKAFCSKLDPRGFWRVDRELPPHERQTMLTLKAFRVIRDSTVLEEAASADAEYTRVSRSEEEAMMDMHREIIARIRKQGIDETEKAPPPKKEMTQGFLF